MATVLTQTEAAKILQSALLEIGVEKPTAVVVVRRLERLFFERPQAAQPLTPKDKEGIIEKVLRDEEVLVTEQQTHWLTNIVVNLSSPVKKGASSFLVRVVRYLTYPVRLVTRQIITPTNRADKTAAGGEGEIKDRFKRTVKKGLDFASRGLLKQALKAMSSVFTKPTLGWLRLGLMGGFGLGALNPAFVLPVRLLFGGLGASFGIAQFRHTPSFFGAAFLRGAAYTRAVIGLIGLGGVGISAITIIIVIIASVVGLIFLTQLNTKQQGLFILEQTPNIFRYIERIPLTASRPQSTKLASLFEKAAVSQCVPPTLMLAIAQIEAGGTFSYSDKEVDRFTSDNWWAVASQEELRRGYCYNTCAQPGVTCGPGSDVRGAMQFEIKTWNNNLAQVKEVLVKEFGISETYEPSRCNLRDIIIGAAIKIKRDSGTNQNQCTTWTEAEVRQTARSYCGSCGTAGSTSPGKYAAACGIDYCGGVWNLYNQYSKLQ